MNCLNSTHHITHPFALKERPPSLIIILEYTSILFTGSSDHHICFQYVTNVPHDDKDTEEHASDQGDPSVSRGKWNRHFDFMLAAVGYSVGMGNIWRFPYIAMRNGGGRFSSN